MQTSRRVFANTIYPFHFHRMKHTPHDPSARVMALTVATGRAGFVVLEGQNFAIDWGTIKLQGLSKKDATEKIVERVATFLPNILILEDPEDDGCRKGDHAKAIIKQIEKKAGSSGWQAPSSLDTYNLL